MINIGAKGRTEKEYKGVIVSWIMR